MCVCEGEGEEGCGGWGSCDPTAPRPASQVPGRPKPTWVPPLRATSWWKPARAAGVWRGGGVLRWLQPLTLRQHSLLLSMVFDCQ